MTSKQKSDQGQMQSMALTHDGDQEQPANDPWSEGQICGTCVDRDDNHHSGRRAHCGVRFKCGGCDLESIACFVVPNLFTKQAD